jgi:hypothetical protein
MREGSPVLCRTPSPTILTIEINGKELDHQSREGSFFEVERDCMYAAAANPDLDRIRVHVNHTCPHSVSIVSAIAESLKEYNIGIDAYFSKVTDRGYKSLQGLFEKNVPLAGIDLKFTSMEDGDLKIIASGLSMNSCIQRLDLSCNMITSGGVEYLREALELNGSLVWISLAENFIGQETLMPVQVNTFTMSSLSSLPSFTPRLEEFLNRNQFNQSRKALTLTEILVRTLLFPEQVAKDRLDAEKRKKGKSWALYEQAMHQLNTFPFFIQFDRLSFSSLRALEWMIEANPTLTHLNLQLRKGSSSKSKRGLCELLNKYPQLTSLGPVLDTRARYRSRLARNRHNRNEREKTLVQRLLMSSSVKGANC